MSVAVDLTTSLAELTLPSPILTAAGCGGTGRELESYLDLSRLGGFTTRTLTLDRRVGTVGARVVPVASGVLHDVGDHNPGVQGFLTAELPWLAQRRVRTIVSVGAGTLADFAELARHAGGAPGVSALEVDLSGRYAGAAAFDHEPFGAGKIVHVVRRETPRGVPVLVKLTPSTHLVDVARQVVQDGADGVVVGHGHPALAFDPLTLRASVSGSSSVMSGPAVLPLTVRAVADVRGALPEVPLVASGGVRSGSDALQLILAGATAVAVGTALLTDPGAPVRIADELATLLRSHGMASPLQLRLAAQESQSVHRNTDDEESHHVLR